MKNILIIGAGRSATSLIHYLLLNAEKENWSITVADISVDLARQKTGNHKSAIPVELDIHNDQQRREAIQKADLVISMLPASLHINVAKDCVYFQKNMTTASYVSKEMAALHDSAKKNGIILLNEMGLDPGIDHASAMKLIDHIHQEGGKLVSFKSYCGGLVAPEYNTNPWGYKFTWNPRNVVLAGQGTAQYMEDGKYKYIPYNRLFKQTTLVTVEGYGAFEAYANRDSLLYRQPYTIHYIPTMLRGTLRVPGFCRAWNIFVKLGLTDDSYFIESANTLTYREWVEAYLPKGKGSLKEKIFTLIGEEIGEEDWEKMEWLGIFEERKLPFKTATPAQLLQNLLEEKWKLESTDRDMVVMQHQIAYINQQKEEKKITSSLVVIGDDVFNTAMAKTVGIPLAIVSKLILQNKISAKGVVIPTIKEIYEPLLKELSLLGINFIEKESD